MKSKVIVQGDGINKLLQQLEDSQNLELNVGFFESAKYEDGTTVASVAYKNEFGDGVSVPARPFMRTAIAEDSSKWAGKLDKSGTAGMDVKKAFALLGGVVKLDIQNAISQVYTPPLAEYTIQKRLEKRSSKERTPEIEKPLIDTGAMIASVNFELKE